MVCRKHLFVAFPKMAQDMTRAHILAVAMWAFFQQLLFSSKFHHAQNTLLVATVKIYFMYHMSHKILLASCLTGGRVGT